VGIIACVVTTTTTGSTAESTSTSSATTIPTTSGISSSPAPPTTSTTVLPTSGTTIIPTSVETTPVCQRDMALVGGVYVSAVTYSVQPINGTNNNDLTSNTTTNGISFPTIPGSTGLFDQNNRPIYNVTITFSPLGADSLSILRINSNSNVNKFAIRFFVPSYPNQPFTFAPQFADIPLYYNSTILNSQTSINYFPPQVPTPISAIRISILSTIDNQ
jgi:hypothetical protein